MEELQWQGDCMCWHVCPPPAAVDQADKGDERLVEALAIAADIIDANIAEDTCRHGAYVFECDGAEDDGCTDRSRRETIRAALASPPQPAPELDVDRLARALHSWLGNDEALAREQAAIIAREYARLATPQEGDTGS